MDSQQPTPIDADNRTPKKKGTCYRKHITEDEVERLIRAAASVGRHGHRDATMILIGYRHGFRASELVNLTWQNIDLKQRVIHVGRLKHGSPSTHPLTRREMAALKRLAKESEWGPLFVSEQGGPMSRFTFAKMIERAGKLAGFGFKIHPHHLRHACGYALANQGRDTRAIQDYLGHRNIQHTVLYTKLAAGRFNGFFED